jgi:hypothetical protein
MFSTLLPGKSRLLMRFVQSLQKLHHRRQSAAFSPTMTTLL